MNLWQFFGVKVMFLQILVLVYRCYLGDPGGKGH